MQEVDNLPYKELMSFAPQMGKFVGDYTTKAPKAAPQAAAPPPGPSQEELAREFMPAEIAAKAAARNQGVRVVPFQTNKQPSSTQQYHHLALKSLRAIPRHMEETLKQERVQIRLIAARKVPTTYIYICVCVCVCVCVCMVVYMYIFLY